jgi:CO/xanthine dehydrogenase FAD-binding subunit
MDAPVSQIFFPSSYNELFNAWNRFPSAVPYAGGTDIIRHQGKDTLELPQIILSLNKLEELHRISRTERYLEIGAMVKLSKIIQLGKIVPGVFSACLENIAGIQLRNIATIGGNICSSRMLPDTAASLSALDAQFELRNADSSRWISASRFFSVNEEVPARELLCRVRLPLDQWDYTIYKKFNSDIHNSEIMVILAKTRKNMLSDIRVVYKEKSVFRSRNSETILIGKHLPLNRKTADDFVKSWEEFIAGIRDINEYSRNKLIKCIEINIYNLSE